MKDIDFDELDRAVNSIMTSRLTTDTSVNSSSSPASKPQEPVSQPVGPERSESVQVNRRSTPVTPPRRSGRFMDMMPAKPLKRPEQAPQIRQNIPERSVEEATTPFASLISSAPVEKPQTAIDDKKSQVVENSTPTQNVEPQPDIQTSSVPVNVRTEEPFESPFLSDAKVEKRPLGSNAFAGSASSEQSVEAPEKEDGPSSSSMPEPTPAVTDIDLRLAELEAEQSSSESSLDQRLESGIGDNSLPERPVGPASITQQYKEVPSTGDQNHAAIYDTSQFAPTPLAHPPKKRSGWLLVIWVLLLLALGAGGAIALYMMNLI